MMARVVHEHHMRMAMWDVSVGDWNTTDPRRHRRRRAPDRRGAARSSTCTTGSTASPSADRSVVVQALPLILDGLRARHSEAGAARPARRRSRVPVVRASTDLTNPTDDVPGGRRRSPGRCLVARVDRGARDLSHARDRAVVGQHQQPRARVVHRRDLWHHGRLPWRMPVLGHGDAYAYPYGFMNWTTAALVWPLFGNWAVTLWTALGVVGCIAGTFVAFPELRRGWWAAAVLANPAIIEALLFGQQSFAWGAALLLFGVAAWRRGRRGWAAMLVGLGQATHPAIVAADGRAPRPALLAVHTRPLGRGALVRSVVRDHVARRGARLRVTVVLRDERRVAGAELLRHPRTPCPHRRAAVALHGRCGAPACARSLPPRSRSRSRAISRSKLPSTLPTSGARSPAERSTPRARRLPARAADSSPARPIGCCADGDGKLGMYHVVQGGGRLDSELFPESMAMHSFDDIADYEAFLCDRHIDQMLHFDSYDKQRHTNEGKMLKALAAHGGSRVQARVWPVGRLGGIRRSIARRCRRSRGIRFPTRCSA